MDDIATLGSVLDSGVLKVREILAGERQDRRCAPLRECDVVSSRGLVAVGGTPEVKVGDGTEVGGSLNWLMGGTILTETDGVVSSYVSNFSNDATLNMQKIRLTDPNNLVMAESREPDGTSCVRDEVLQLTVSGRRPRLPQERLTMKVATMGRTPPYADKP